MDQRSRHFIKKRGSMKFTDSHCHLDDDLFQNQLPELLKACQQHAIHRIIIPSISPDNFDTVLSLSKNTDNQQVAIFSGLGIHPWFLDDLDDTHLSLMSQQVAQHKQDIIAIGEIGIDGAISKRAENPEENLKKQQHFFDYQLAVAKQHNLPVIIHHRQSHDKILPQIKHYQLERSGVIHGFSGSYQQAKAYLDLGYKLGVGSTITYSRAKKTINTIKRLPLTSIVLETDAPSMPLSKEVMNETELQLPYNSPVNLLKIFSALNMIREENAEDIAEQIEQNVEQLFFRCFS